MGATTGISWTDATVNFWIGCTRVGPGCDGCYAAALARRRFGIIFERGGERRPTKYALTDPPKWEREHKRRGVAFPGADDLPLWVFAMSLGDFFDKEAPPALRAQAWSVIRSTPSLRWQIVTKRVGLIERFLPDDWDRGRGYEHVGIIATVIDQDEYERDAPKLHALYRLGVRWTGLSIEPQLGLVVPRLRTDWIITGGESTQDGHVGRLYDLAWARALIRYGRATCTPVFVKQLGAQPFDRGAPAMMANHGSAHDKPTRWPDDLRVQQMPRVYSGASP